MNNDDTSSPDAGAVSRPRSRLNRLRFVRQDPNQT
jgi:hypothetical protein